MDDKGARTELIRMGKSPRELEPKPRVKLGVVRQADGFLNASFLRAFREAPLDKGSEVEEERVVIYLSLLLSELSRSGGMARYLEFVELHDADLADRCRKGTSRRERLHLYRTNADYLLISLGLFDRPLWGRAGRGHGQDELRRIMESRGEHLYRLAAVQAEALYGREAELTRVLDLLSSQFSRYHRVLSTLSGEHLGLAPRLSPGREFHLLRVAHGTDREGMARRRWDHLLDVFTSWRRRRSRVTRDRLVRAVSLLSEVEPSFSRTRFAEEMCRIIRMDSIPGGMDERFHDRSAEERAETSDEKAA